jgi:hypothetical protein
MSAPEPLRAYTPEQVFENGWLGEITPDAMRKAAKDKVWPHVKLRNKIHFTGQNIAEILADAQVDAEDNSTRVHAPRRRGRRAAPELQPGVPLLVAKSAPARRRGRKAS